MGKSTNLHYVPRWWHGEGYRARRTELARQNLLRFLHEIEIIEQLLHRPEPELGRGHLVYDVEDWLERVIERCDHWMRDLRPTRNATLERRVLAVRRTASSRYLVHRFGFRAQSA